jgi:C2 domain
MLSSSAHPGYINDRGDYKNPSAPWNHLLVEVWDWDSLKPDAFVGEFVVPLTLLMDGAEHAAWHTLTDPRARRSSNAGDATAAAAATASGTDGDAEGAPPAAGPGQVYVKLAVKA